LTGESALSFAEKRDWLRLSRTPTVGPAAFRDLIARFKTAGDALTALPDLVRGKSLDIPPIEAIEAEMDHAQQMGVRIIAACEPDYPPYLRAVDPAPPLITVLGQPEILHHPCVAIVGSRKEGHLGEAGYMIISGLARGIDPQAHHGALNTGTAAVLGGGVDNIYPRQNTDLYHAMAKTGAIISESPLGYSATARDFPRRNRIISGLSLGVVVIEAAIRSGTLITARYAMEQNREVMAAPGSPLDPRTKGCNRLIQQGAALIENAEDVIKCLETLQPIGLSEPTRRYDPTDLNGHASARDVDAARRSILDLLSPTPAPRDEIIRLSGLDIALATATLLEMELGGEILVEPDGRIGSAA